jgi:hypothetical protein
VETPSVSLDYRQELRYLRGAENDQCRRLDGICFSIFQGQGFPIEVTNQERKPEIRKLDNLAMK